MQAPNAAHRAVLRSGPHFLDWAELAERGAASCVSVPVYLNGVPRGVITFASAEPGIFSRWDTYSPRAETASVNAHMHLMITMTGSPASSP